MKRLICATLLCCACGRSPAWYPPPPQKTVLTGAEPQALRSVLEMKDLDFKLFTKAGILSDEDGEEWRWTKDHAEFQLIPPQEKDLELFVDFRIVEKTFKDTGPVTITAKINGREAGRATYSGPGKMSAAWELTPETLAEPRPLLVSLDISPPWIAPNDGTHLGVFLKAIGFRKRKTT